MSKDLPQLQLGRAFRKARTEALKHPKSVGQSEFDSIKVLLKYWKYTDIAARIGRGQNTILRVKKAKDWSGYKKIINRATGRRVVKVNFQPTITTSSNAPEKFNSQEIVDLAWEKIAPIVQREELHQMKTTSMTLFLLTALVAVQLLSLYVTLFVR